MTTAATPEAIAWDFPDHLRKALRVGGLTTAEIADELGVSRATVSNWLNGHGRPRAGMLRAWASLCGVPFEWLCAARDSNPEPADYWSSAPAAA